MLEKMRGGLEKNKCVFIDFSSKIDYKSIEKSRKTTFAAKIDEKALPGTAFWGKKRFLVIFGLPRGTQKCARRGDHHWGKPLVGAILCHFGHFNALFSILAAFWAHSGLLQGLFSTNFECFCEFWKGCWGVGLLGCWVVGLLGCWVVGLLGCWVVGLLVCWFVGLLTLSPLRVYKAATQQDSRKRTRQQHNGIVRQNHNKPTRKQRSKTAGQHDNKTATKPPTNPPTNWCGPVECAKRLNYILIRLRRQVLISLRTAVLRAIRTNMTAWTCWVCADATIAGSSSMRFWFKDWRHFVSRLKDLTANWGQGSEPCWLKTKRLNYCARNVEIYVQGFLGFPSH